MDRTSIIVLVVCFALIFVWQGVVVKRLYPPRPLPVAATNAATPTTTVTATNAPLVAEASPVLSNAIATAAVAIETNLPEELLTITNENARYTFTSHGGGLKLVELVRYPEKVSTRRERHAQTNSVATLNTYTPDPTLGLLEGNGFGGKGDFKLLQVPGGVRAERTLTNGLTIIKSFQLDTNYLVAATVRVENHSAQPMKIPTQYWVAGTATPMGASDNGQAVGVVWYNGSKTEDISAPWFANKSLGCIPGAPRTEYRAGSNNVTWVAVHNQFFALAVMPKQPALEMVARKIDLPRPTGEEASMVATNAAAPLGYEAALVYPAATLAPNGALEHQISIYAGPKEYQTLVRIGDRFNNNLDALMNFGWFGFVSKALLLGMNWLHHSLRLSYAWAIVAITLIIKLIYWPLTQHSTRSMKRMQALQPQMNAIREKYKDDPLKMNRKTMEFMKEHKVSPMGGCLPSLLQIPVFFGFYRMIQSAIELRGAPFLWAGDLSKPDTLYVVSGLGFVPFIGIPGVGLPINVLPLIMGATMLWQARLAPPSPGVDPMQAKMMRYMPLMFMVFLYNFSAGLTLYWTVQNLFTIFQTKMTRTAPENPAPPAKAAVLTPVPKKRNR